MQKTFNNSENSSYAELLRLAVHAHKKWGLAEAEQLCKKVLQLNKDYFDALVLFASILHKRIGPGVRCRLAFLDGDHSYDAVCADIPHIEPYLVEGGWICFYDAFSTFKGVDRAIADKLLHGDKYDLRQQLTRKLFAARRARSR